MQATSVSRPLSFCHGRLANYNAHPSFFITACMTHIAWIAYEDDAVFITPFPAWLSAGAAYACPFLKPTSSTCIRIWNIVECGIIYFEGSAIASLKYISRSKKKSIHTNYKPSAKEKNWRGNNRKPQERRKPKTPRTNTKEDSATLTPEHWLT